MSHYHWGHDQSQTFAFHAVPSIGPIVSDMNLHGQQNML